MGYLGTIFTKVLWNYFGLFRNYFGKYALKNLFWSLINILWKSYFNLNYLGIILPNILYIIYILYYIYYKYLIFIIINYNNNILYYFENYIIFEIL